jgi:Domain of unknown function (DUF1902)
MHRERHLGRRSSGLVADSADVPGLCTEAATVEQLNQKLEAMIPELLENLPSRVSVRLEAY